MLDLAGEADPWIQAAARSAWHDPEHIPDPVDAEPVAIDAIPLLAGTNFWSRVKARQSGQPPAPSMRPGGSDAPSGPRTSPRPTYLPGRPAGPKMPFFRRKGRCVWPLRSSVISSGGASLGVVIVIVSASHRSLARSLSRALARPSQANEVQIGQAVADFRTLREGLSDQSQMRQALAHFGTWWALASTCWRGPTLPACRRRVALPGDGGWCRA